MKNYLLIVRPFNCLFIGLAVLTGGLLNNTVEEAAVLIFGVMAAMLIAAGGYVINDFYDLPIDLVNKPRRILPRGRIKADKAYIYAMFLFVAGFSISFFTANLNAIALAIINSLLLYFYAKRLKKVVLVSNLIIGYTAASTFLFGAIITGNLRNIFPIVVYTFLYTMVREIIKDAEDVKGDKRFGVSTLATIKGEKAAITYSLLPAILVIVSLWFSYSKNLISGSVLTTIFVLYTIPLLLIYFYLFVKLTAAKLHKTSILIKIHMLFLLVVLVIIS